MLPNFKHFPVHWIDGMKISKQHFIESDNAMLDQLRDARLQNLTPYSYGLLAPDSGFGDSYELNLQQGHLELTACEAITQGGARISISPLHSLTPPLRCALDQLEQGQEYEVVLSVDLFHRQPAGSPKAEESPARAPFSVPTYRLELVPAGTTRPASHESHLCVGKLRLGHNGPELLEYIPACTRTQAHSRLQQFFQHFVNQLYQIRLYSTEIVQKARELLEQGRAQENDRKLAGSLEYVAEKVAYHLADSLDAFEETGLYLPPVYMFTYAQGLSRTIETALACRFQSERDDVLQFFAHILGQGKGDVDQIFSILPSRGDLQYNHLDILHSLVQPVGQFADIVEQLFQQLAEGDIQWKKQVVRKVYTQTQGGHTVGQVGRNTPPPPPKDTPDSRGGISIKRKNPF